ncbi:rhomboid family intramembrane serine protease [Halobacterium zhouii]|uniref:rhomboid family intramembrane serine protease n=1 Tax=Halobacterium zhouii TaxID=2902624 RepID=UPI001E4AAE5F|nr:rhomboid family intramembrane serine protease [Halobacterium zhouii]
MATCDRCGEQEPMPYRCRLCGGTYCSDHRLPENHNCPGLDEWDDPNGVFDSGFDDSGGKQQQQAEGSVVSRVTPDASTGGLFGYFRGNMTYVFLALMWLTFVAQLIFQSTIDSQADVALYESIFVLTTTHPEYVWTWFTSIFAHAGFSHIFVNSIVIFFFGRLVEDYVGSREFSVLFLASGALAGLSQILVGLLQSTPAGVVGASGAGLAIMGVLTVLNPGLRVYLYFILPVPIWVLTGLYAVVSVIGIVGPSIAGANVANAAHLVGLLIGLAYGKHVEGRGRTPRQLQFGGGGGGRGGPGRGRF